MQEHFGVMKLSVEKLRKRGFEFDEPVAGHVNITNVPFYRKDDEEELKRANESSSWMIECVEEIIPANAVPAE